MKDAAAAMPLKRLPATPETLPRIEPEKWPEEPLENALARQPAQAVAAPGTVALCRLIVGGCKRFGVHGRMERARPTANSLASFIIEPREPGDRQVQ